MASFRRGRGIWTKDPGSRGHSGPGLGQRGTGASPPCRDPRQPGGVLGGRLQPGLGDPGSGAGVPGRRAGLLRQEGDGYQARERVPGRARWGENPGEGDTWRVRRKQGSERPEEGSGERVTVGAPRSCSAPPASLRFASRACKIRAVGGKPERSASAGGGRGEDPVDLYVAADVVCF